MSYGDFKCLIDLINYIVHLLNLDRFFSEKNLTRLLFIYNISRHFFSKFPEGFENDFDTPLLEVFGR